MGQLVFQSTAGGQVALVGPNPSSSFALNVPAVNGNLVTTGDTVSMQGTIIFQNDNNGKGDYIKSWTNSNPQPTTEQLNATGK